MLSALLLDLCSLDLYVYFALNELQSSLEGLYKTVNWPGTPYYPIIYAKITAMASQMFIKSKHIC